MIQEFKIEGLWWLVGKSKNKIQGTLGFNPNEGATLELKGIFKDILSLDEPFFRTEIILGKSFDNAKVTLFKCYTTFFETGTRTSSSFAAGEVFLGVHFRKRENLKFNALSIQYSFLDLWVGISGLNAPLHTSQELTLNYNQPNSIRAATFDNYTISITFANALGVLSLTHSKNWQKEAIIRPKTFIKIECTHKESYEKFKEIMRNFENFLSLVVQEPVYPLVVAGLTTSGNSLITIFRGFPDAPKSFEFPHHMLFTYRDVEDKLESLLKNWFKKAELLEPVYELYFDIFYNSRISRRHQFLNLVQALESYHRRRLRNYELSEDEHTKRIQEILNAVPESYKAWLEGELGYSNEPHLSVRLEEILDNYSLITERFIKSNTMKKKFIWKITTTRNYNTHFDETGKDQAIKNESLPSYINKLKLLVETSLLSEMGLSIQEIKDKFIKTGYL